MTRKDYKYTEAFCNRYGKQVVLALKKRAPVDTGSLRADITYRLTFYSESFRVKFYIDNHIMPVNSNLLPSEYGYILNKYDYLDKTHGGRSTQYWFSAPIPGLDQKYFNKNLGIEMAKDMDKYLQNVINKK